MANAFDKDALAKLPSELQLYEEPSVIHHDINSVIALRITR